MGSVSLTIGDGTARFHRSSSLCPSLIHVIMLLSVLITNLFALYAFTSSPTNPNPNNNPNPNSISLQISSILRDISLSDRKLHQLQLSLAGYSSLDPTSPKLPSELRLYLSRHPLPLGPDSRSAMAHLVSSVAHSCIPETLTQFMSYTPYSHCPLGPTPPCDPLPRRRCLSLSLPTGPPTNGFVVDQILALAEIRIGLDFVAANADFAATMAARNVTIITTSATGIYKEGILSLVMSKEQRLPFYDNLFDLVRMVEGVEDAEGMEFLVFDLDRVIRPGGLLWLDGYCFKDDERKRRLTRLVESFGYKKVKWVVGERGEGKGKVYLSALLRKPVRG